jgi:hypothetical protein
LALRWQSRLNSLPTRQGHEGDNAQQNDVFGDLSDIFDVIGARDNNNSTLIGLRANGNANNEDDGNDSDEDSSVVENEDGGEDMEEDDAGGEDEDDSDFDDFASVSDEEPNENDSAMMEEVDRSIGTGQRAIDQPRSVSLSSDDL